MIIGTRGSALAKAQANYVAELLFNKLGQRPEITIIHTQGDRVTDRPLRELEGSGYFTREIEEALLVGSIDVAVHSFKDLPSRTPKGLALAAVSEREDPADLLIIQPNSFEPVKGILPIRTNAVIGTSAVRRISQMKALRGDLQVKDLRGNVTTRLTKLREGQYNAISLAAAGINRLNLDLSDLQMVRLDPARFVPSPGQGALAIQMRDGNPNFQAVRAALHDETTATATSSERAVQARFGGGCGLPLGVYTRWAEEAWQAYGYWGGKASGPVWGEAQSADPMKLADDLFSMLCRGKAFVQ